MIGQVTSKKIFKQSTGVAAAIISGLMLAFSICKPGMWQLSWVALVPVMLACRGQRTGAAAGLWFVTGIVYYGILVSWMRIFGNEPWVLLVVFQALYYLGFGFFAGYVGNSKANVALKYSIPLFWIVMQWVRGLGMFGFTWGSLAHIQAASVLAMRPAIFGTSILELLVFCANVILASILIFLFHRKHEGIYRKTILAQTLVFVAVLILFHLGAVHLQRNFETDSPISVAVLQGNEPQNVTVTDEYLSSVYSIYTQMSLYVRSPAPRLVVWPETTIPDDFTALGFEARTQALAILTDSCYLVGAYSPSNIPGNRSLYNSAYVIDRDGKTKGIYSKVHLVPFGEFVPLRKYLQPLISKFPVREDDVLTGNSRQPIKSSVGKIGTLICFESLFPEYARQEVADGAEILVVITNDSWFGRTQAAYQHLLQSRLRAVETGRPVIRAAATGISAIIEPDGRIQRAAGLYRQSTLKGRVYTQRHKTCYTAIGDTPVYLALLGSLAAIFIKVTNTVKKQIPKTDQPR